MIRIHGHQTKDLIASGGTSDVYEGIRDNDGKKVAIKVLNETLSKDPGIKQRLLREAKIISQLNHRNLVKVFNYGTTGTRLYMVMEFLAGGSLVDHRQWGQRFCLKTLIQICDGVRFIHEKGIVHRDLKPSNILFGSDGLPRLVDFGISLFVNEDFTRLTHTHLVMGTLAYMSPEQQTSPQDVDHRSDIYSLGVILYEMFTGKKPIGRFANPSEVIDGFSPELEKTILTCLEEKPANRFQQVAPLQQSLIDLWEDGLFADESDRSPLMSYDERVGYWIQQWKHGSSKDKMLAKQALLEQVRPEDVTALRELIENGDDNLRLALLPALGRLNLPEVLPVLLEYLGNPLFTRELCAALGQMGQVEALPALIKLAKKRNAFSDAALVPIGRLGTEKHLKVVLPFLKASNPSERLEAVRALSSAKARKYLKQLKKALKTEQDVQVRNHLYALVQRLESS